MGFDLGESMMYFSIRLETLSDGTAAWKARQNLLLLFAQGFWMLFVKEAHVTCQGQPVLLTKAEIYLCVKGSFPQTLAVLNFTPPPGKGT